MVKKYKILPAVATLALSVAGLVNANNASAYVITNETGVGDVEICHTLNNVYNAVNVDYTYTLSNADALGVKFTNVSVTGGDISSKTADQLVVVMHFAADGSTTSPSQCVTLDFTSAMDASEEFGDKTVSVLETSSDSAHYPADSTARNIMFSYQLNTDSNRLPIASGDDYSTLFSVKSEPTFTSNAVTAQTYITLDKKVRGNGARTEDDFTFTINLAKPANVSANTYNVFVDGVSSAPQTCYFTNASGYDSNTPCTVTLKHNQTAYIGCTNCGSSSRAGTLYVGSGSSYSITETAATGYTTTYAPIVNGTVGTEVSGNTFTKNALEEGDRVLFYNEKTFSPTGRFLAIFPFVILAIAAGATIIVVRKTSKNKEQA